VRNRVRVTLGCAFVCLMFVVSAGVARSLKAKRCPRGSSVVSVAGRSACWRLPRISGKLNGPALSEGTESVAVGSASAALAQAGSNGESLDGALALGEPTLDSMLATTIAGANREEGLVLARDSSLPPYSIEEIPAPSGEAGGGAKLTVPPTTITKGAFSLTLSGTAQFTSFVDQCPNDSGNSIGNTAGSLTFHAVLSGPLGVSGVLDATAQVTARLTGHVGQDGKLKDYDADVHASGSAKGGVTAVGVIPVYKLNDLGSLHIVLVGLTLGESGNPKLLDSFLAGGSGHIGLINYRGTDIGGSVDAQGNLVGQTAQGIGAVAELGTVLLADGAFPPAQKNWYDYAACLTAKFDPSSLEHLKGGSTKTIQVSVGSVRDGKDVKIPLDAKASSGSSVTPSQQTAKPGQPAQFRFTISKNETEYSTLSVSGTSNRGRVVGLISTVPRPICGIPPHAREPHSMPRC